MKRIACVALVAALALTVASAQDRSYTWSAPTVPAREVLDRLNLRLGWSTYIQTESKRDGLATIQLAGRMLLTQTRSGLITALDAETGQTRWRARVGLPYQRALPIAFNKKAVFVVNSTRLFSLDRETGASVWDIEIPEGVSVAPVGGDLQVYVSTAAGRLLAYLLPASQQSGVTGATSEVQSYVRGEEFSSTFPAGTAGEKPLLAWEALTRIRLEYAPVTGQKGILAVSPAGEIVSYEKIPVQTRRETEMFRENISDGPIPVTPGQYEEMVYIGATDSNVYAVNIDRGNIAWRFTAGTPIKRQPIATEKDVYVVATQMGLARVDRATGIATWSLPRGNVAYPANLEADRFLAANPKFVYAADASGRLLVLDRATGLRLSIFEGTRDFTVPFSNAANDRIYLAANNGLIVCLHDRDYPTPFRHARGEERAVDPQVAEVEEKLSKLITQSEKEPIPLGAMLADLLGEKNGSIKYAISGNAFKEAGIAGVEDRKVSLPRLDGVPLREVLHRVLTQVDATFRIYKDHILIFPNLKKAAS